MAKPQHITPLVLLTLVVALASTGCQASSSPSSQPPSSRPAVVTTAAPSSASPTSASPKAAPSTTSSAAAGKVAAAAIMLAHVAIGGRGPKTGYVRAVVFGNAWVDVNANGCGTRDDILTRDLTSVGKRNSCVVVSGLLHDPYTGHTVAFAKADASAVQIDHVVPLGLAWQLGAAQWSQGKRVTFASDPANLLAVAGSANDSKSDSGPDSWLPPSKAYRCTYVIHFAKVASLYGLRITPSMHTAIAAQLGSCATVIGSPAGLKALPSSDWTRAARIGAGTGTVATVTTTPATHPAVTTSPATHPAVTTSPATHATSSASTGGAAYYANCAAVRAAGKTPLLRGQPGYRSGLDRDGDGIACE